MKESLDPGRVGGNGLDEGNNGKWAETRKKWLDEGSQ